MKLAKEIVDLIASLCWAAIPCYLIYLCITAKRKP